MQQNYASINNRYQGVRGWLLLFCVSLTILNPTLSIIFNFSTLGGTLLATNRFIFSEEADIISVIIIISCAMCLKIIISIIAGVLLWRKSIRSVNVAKFYLIVLLLLSIISSFTPLITNVHSFLGIGGNIFWALAIERTIFSAIFFTIWYLYLNKSKRIKETYPIITIKVDILSYKSFVQMFNKIKYRVNHYMFPSLFTFKFFSIFTFGMVFLIFNPTGYITISYRDFFIALLMGFLYSISFLLAVYLLKRDWILLTIWPLVYALLTAMHLFLRTAIISNEIVFFDTSNIIYIIKAIVLEWLFIIALILAIRIWGIRFWSIIGAVFVFVTIAFFISNTLRTETFYFEYLITVIIRYLVEGVLIFVAIKFHLSDVGSNEEIGQKLAIN